MIIEKYGFRVGEKVLWTSGRNGRTGVGIIKSFDPYPDQGHPYCEGILLTDNDGWDIVARFSKIQPCDGNQLLFSFMGV